MAELTTEPADKPMTKERLAEADEWIQNHMGVGWVYGVVGRKLMRKLVAEVRRCWGRPPGPTRVCLCGSTRFMEAFFAAGWQLTLMGQIVLSVGVCKHADENGAHGAEMLGQDVADALDELHLRKIDLADWVLVLNVNNYVGDSTRKEIKYASKTHKPVKFLLLTGDTCESWDDTTRLAKRAAKDQLAGLKGGGE